MIYLFAWTQGLSKEKSDKPEEIGALRDCDTEPRFFTFEVLNRTADTTWKPNYRREEFRLFLCHEATP